MYLNMHVHWIHNSVIFIRIVDRQTRNLNSCNSKSLNFISDLHLNLSCNSAWIIWLLMQGVSIVLGGHYDDVILSAIVSQITSLAIVYSTVHSGTDEIKHQSSASLAFVRGIRRWPVSSNFMTSSWQHILVVPYSFAESSKSWIEMDIYNNQQFEKHDAA